MRSALFTVLCALASAVLLTGGCDSDSTGPSGIVQVRVAHLSPDAPAVDVLVDGEVVLAGVPFKAISEYLSLDAGAYRIQVTPAGNPAVSVIDTDVEFQGGRFYTVAATGLLAAGDVQAIVLATDPAMSDEAEVRFAHTSPDAPAVDIAVAGGPVLFSNVSFRQVSDYLSVAGGTYDLEVRVAGTSTVALTVPGVALMDGRKYTVFAVGTLATLEALLVVDS